MHVNTINQNSYKLELTQDELIVLCQSLNEVCHGFHIDNFEESVGDRTSAITELEKLSAIVDDSESHDTELLLSLETTIQQLLLYRNALRAVCKEVDEWEFTTRIGGVKKEVAENMLTTLNAIVR